MSNNLDFTGLTVLTPIKESVSITEWIKQNTLFLPQMIVFDSGGGEELENNCLKYIKKDVSEWDARLILIHEVRTPFVLNLDCWNILPIKYVTEAISLLREDKIDATAIDYEQSIGHYGFGTSMWKTSILKEVYDYPPRALELAMQKENEFHMFRYTICECSYLWNKLFNLKKRFKPLLYKATNLRPHHGN